MCLKADNAIHWISTIGVPDNYVLDIDLSSGSRDLRFEQLGPGRYFSFLFSLVTDSKVHYQLFCGQYDT